VTRLILPCTQLKDPPDRSVLRGSSPTGEWRVEGELHAAAPHAAAM